MRRSKSALPMPPAPRVVGHTGGELESIPAAQWQLLEQRATILRSFGEGAMTHAQAERKR